MWKLTYGLTIVKEGEEELIEVNDDDDDDDDDNDDTIKEGTEMHIDDKTIIELEHHEG